MKDIESVKNSVELYSGFEQLCGDTSVYVAQVKSINRKKFILTEVDIEEYLKGNPYKNSIKKMCNKLFRIKDKIDVNKCLVLEPDRNIPVKRGITLYSIKHDVAFNLINNEGVGNMGVNFSHQDLRESRSYLKSCNFSLAELRRFNEERISRYE